jgi:hypothetical protein
MTDVRKRGSNLRLCMYINQKFRRSSRLRNVSGDQSSQILNPEEWVRNSQVNCYSWINSTLELSISKYVVLDTNPSKAMNLRIMAHSTKKKISANSYPVTPTPRYLVSLRYKVVIRQWSTEIKCTHRFEK